MLHLLDHRTSPLVLQVEMEEAEVDTKTVDTIHIAKEEEDK